MKIVTADQMRTIEDRSEDEAGVPKDTLMETAGLGFAKRVRDQVRHIKGAPILVIVGPGNNGADGLVSARHLQRWGANVTAYLVRDRRTPDPKLDLAVDADVHIISTSADDDLAIFKKLLGSAHAVVDSVLGIGSVRPLEGIVKDIFAELKKAKAKNPTMRIVAMDVPTGLNSDTGEFDPAGVAPDVTVTLGYPKTGLFEYPGADSIGELIIEGIGLPNGLDTDVTLELMTPAWAKALLPNRPSSSHKGTFGRTLVIAGSINYIGAAYLASTSATRVGAGLVTVALPQSLQMAVASKATEPTFIPLPESSPGIVSPDAADLIFENIDAYESLLIGCGMGQAPQTAEFVERILLSGKQVPNTVVDADGLNILAKTNDWWQKFPQNAIATPHPGEMSRLTREGMETVQGNRVSIASESAKAWNKVTVLKGAHTVVAQPDGRSMLSPFKNPGLASAGTGDVLAGAIVGLLSQGLALEDAAALGVYLHGLAGDRVRNDLGDSGMIASDLLPMLPRVIKHLREQT